MNIPDSLPTDPLCIHCVTAVTAPAPGGRIGCQETSEGWVHFDCAREYDVALEREAEFFGRLMQRDHETEWHERNEWGRW